MDYNEKRCTICSRLIDPKRLASYPHARTCGERYCYATNRRRVHTELTLRIKRRARAAKKEQAEALQAWALHAKARVQESLQAAERAADTVMPKSWADRATAAESATNGNGARNQGRLIRGINHV